MACSICIPNSLGIAAKPARVPHPVRAATGWGTETTSEELFDSRSVPIRCRTVGLVAARRSCRIDACITRDMGVAE